MPALSFRMLRQAIPFSEQRRLQTVSSSSLVKHPLPEAPGSCSALGSRNSKLNLAVAGPGRAGKPTLDRDSKPRGSGNKAWAWRNDTNLKPGNLTQFCQKLQYTENTDNH